MSSNELYGGNQNEQNDEIPVMEQAFEHVEIFFADLSAVDHVEKLQGNKDIEDVGEVLGLGLRHNVEFVFSCVGSISSGVETIWF